MQKCNFCISVGKTNFTDHHKPDTINSFRDSVLVCKIYNCYCTVQYAKFQAFLFLLIRPSHEAMQVIATVRLYENKPLQNAFTHI